MNAEQAARADAVRVALHLMQHDPETTSTADVIAVAEWINEGSISAALTLRGQTTAMYRDLSGEAKP